MFKSRWVSFGIIALCSVMVVSGCKSKSKRGSADIDNIGGVMGSDVYGSELAPRPGEGSLVESQFDSVFFAYDSSQINPTERSKIEEVADYLRGDRGTGLIVEGHADERGSREYNLALGERRALAVRAYLIGLGVDGSRIQTKSYGEEQPSTMSHDEEAWSANRRAEFVVYN